MSTSLNRITAARHVGDPAPVRVVHLGLGAFHRAHQAWYTQHAESDARDPKWGIAAFTGRSPVAAEELAPQDGLYSLVERAADADSVELIQSIVEVRPASDSKRLVQLLSAPEIALVTLTITEAGYHLDPAGELKATDEDVAADIAILREALSDPSQDPPLLTAAGRLVLGLDRRLRSLGNEAGIAVVSCDNMADNATATRNAVLGTAHACKDGLAEEIDRVVSWVGTSVDRITPAATEELAQFVAEKTGFDDAAPVVAEPFRSWIFSGDFPGGRPEWERGGAQFVDDLEPFERRKLWLLNGTHSYMAYAGQLAEHRTVAEAIADPAILSKIEAFWDEASRHLTDPQLDVPSYREDLLTRYRNPRIQHFLAQIGTDGASKLRIRALPIYQAEREAGRDGAAAAGAIASWIAWLITQDSRDIKDSEVDSIRQALASDDTTRALLDVLQPGLGQDTHLVSLVRSHN